MPKLILLDNDVVLKVSCYSLAQEALAVMNADNVPLAALKVCKFVIQAKLKRSSNFRDPLKVRASFEELAQRIEFLEPNEEEIVVAAELEAKAHRENLELDSGESQLLAVLANRNCRLLVTGDKRAISAMAVVAMNEAANRIGCCEQLIVSLLKHAGLESTRSRICAEPQADRAISICFSCSHNSAEHDEVMAGLVSYIEHLANTAPGVLVPGNDLADAIYR